MPNSPPQEAGVVAGEHGQLGTEALRDRCAARAAISPSDSCPAAMTTRADALARASTSGW